jgi:hypothetical protein
VRILFDQGAPAPLRSYLSAHQVSTAFELNWGALKNGDLLSEAEAAGFEVLFETAIESAGYRSVRQVLLKGGLVLHHAN